MMDTWEIGILSISTNSCSKFVRKLDELDANDNLVFFLFFLILAMHIQNIKLK